MPARARPALVFGPSSAMELSSYTFEVLRGDELATLYRGRGPGGSSLLLLSLRTAFPAPDVLKRLEHEQSFRDELDPKWAARPIASANHGDHAAVVLEDPGGVPLERLIGLGMELGLSLRVAAGFHPR